MTTKGRGKVGTNLYYRIAIHWFRGTTHTFPFISGMIIAVIISALNPFPHTATAQTCNKWVAKVVSVEGSVEVRKAGSMNWETVHMNDTYCPGDTIRVLDKSRADVALSNQPLVRLDQNTTITFAGVKEEESTLADLFKGAVQLDLVQGVAHFFSRLPRNLEVRTAFVNAGVEGTEFLVKVDNKQTLISVFEGKVVAANEAGNIPIGSGQAAVAEKGKAPAYMTVVQQRDAVLWALYYPPVLYGQSKAGESMVSQAAELLSVGRVDEANASLSKALSMEPSNSNALALQSIIAVIKNEKSKALDLARKAVEADAGSAAALIAQSYAQQAEFDLEGACASLEKAVQVEPDNALAWARMAELWSSFGYLDKALESAQKAVDLDSSLSRTQTVLGFAYLAQVKTAEAKKAFNKAIELEQADSLPRLGLGLAMIRDGNLEEGRREIEVAASLNPNSSIIRSYLGKAYYEEKSSGLDGREFAIAKELDPNDPTPWFYDAIQKQTTNRPVEALQDLQKAIELNDNRAVYRSKLSLDSDLAARSAATARIYNDLGFGQLGLVEGYNAVIADPTNFSAHRFLSDTYATLPRHEIARVSELLQSQLLQPINITPIQPALAESNLFLISAQGAAQTSFNEFNPLFARNGAALQGSGLYGSNDTWAGEGIVSGIYKGISLSAGYSHFDTDGWRENADQEDDIANIFVQWEITLKTSIQAEYRYRDTERGDIEQRFFQEDFNPDQRNEIETRSGRIGLRHAFAPGSIVLGNFQYAEREDNFVNVFLFDGTFDGFPPPPLAEDIFDNPIEEDGYAGELSYLLRSKYIDLVSGAGYVRQDEKQTFTDTFQWPGTDPSTFIFSYSDILDYEINHYNLYAYTNVNTFENLTLTVGASYDFFDQEEQNFGEENFDSSQFNPKLGVSWNPIPSTTIRGAAFRTLTRTLVTDQTLEPTQVAGFNQFFDDPEATETWVYGVALDQKFAKDVYFGAEFSYRDLTVPFIDLDLTLKEADWEEYLGRAYLNWTPHEWLAVKAEYLYEKFEREEKFPDGILDLKTHQFPLGINFFHPSGLSVGLTATYYDQEGTFERTVIDFGVFEDGDDQFWLVDAAISYRFPKRYGLVTVGVKNLFDEEFNYYEVDRNNLRIQPDTQIFCKLTLALP